MTGKEQSRRAERVLTSRRHVAAAVFGALLVAATTAAAVTLARPTSHGGPLSHGMSLPASAASEANSNEATVGGAPPQEGGGQQTESDKAVIALSSSGFAPTQVNHTAGNFALAVEAQDVTSEYVLHLKDAGGTVLNEVRVLNGSAVWPVDLLPGSYTLLVVNHPDWVCQITVQ